MNGTVFLLKIHIFHFILNKFIYGLSRGSNPKSKTEKMERELMSKKMSHSMNQIDTDDEQHFREEKNMKWGEEEKKKSK